MEKRILTHKEIRILAYSISTHFPDKQEEIRCYPVPRGGIPCAYALLEYLPMGIVDKPEDATFILDDIVDSGATREFFGDKYPELPFYAFIENKEDVWYVFPWEHKEGHDEGIENNITRILQHIGEQPSRDGLLETPARVAKAWAHWTSGYGKEPSEVLKTFSDGAEHYDQMIVVRDIPFYSQCEHHMAPFFGTADVAYIPNKKIVGLSKLSRLTDLYARRLQVQERLTNQIAQALQDNLNPVGVGVMLKARHLCMESRGICQQGHHTVTSALLGVFREQEVREEFMNLCKS